MPPPPDGYAPLYLCNVASSQSVVGTSIDFLVGGTRSVTLAAGESLGPTSCMKLDVYAVGTSVTLQELVPVGIAATSASFAYNPPGGRTDYDAAAVLATIAVGPVTNVFTFSDGPATSSEAELCTTRGRPGGAPPRHEPAHTLLPTGASDMRVERIV